MRQLYGENFFVDRRIDPATRITIDMTATGAEPAAAAIAAKHRWSTTRVGDVVYLGPADAASIVKALRDARRGDVAKLPPQQRALFQRKQSIQWPRLTEPRELIQKLVERTGWRVVDDERIPHDLWPAGELKSMTLADQLTLLLIGFNLTFEMDAADQVVRVVELKNPARLAASAPSTRPPRTDPAPAARNPESATKQVYTLRVAEKRVGPVLQELSRRLGWKIEYDDDAIRAADLSLDTRVSFTVENADQDQLLNALLHPAGLTHRHDGDRIIIAPREQ